MHATTDGAMQVPDDQTSGGVAIAVQPGPDNQNEVTTTSLGTQTVNGVQAQGTRYTRTIPAVRLGTPSQSPSSPSDGIHPTCKWW